MNKLDFLIVGSGLCGSVFAHEAHKMGAKVAIIEKRSHIGGNTYTSNINGIEVHTYGSHIFNTSNKKIWEYIQKFTEFHQYKHFGINQYQGKKYSFPINLMTFQQVYGVSTPKEAKEIIENERIKIPNPNNFEDYTVSQIGPKLYEILYKGYTQKQWQRKPSTLPANIAKRIPIRFTFDNNYYSSKFQGIPVNGYTSIIEKMLDNIPVYLNTDFAELKKVWSKYAHNLFYTGSLDEFFDYQFGILEYRTLRWEHEILDNDYQGHSVIHYSDVEIPYTRIIEHKHFASPEHPVTIISKEFSEEFQEGKERLYPIRDNKNIELHQKYLDIAREKGIQGAGRLFNYIYINMDQAIAMALKKVGELLPT